MTFYDDVVWKAAEGLNWSHYAIYVTDYPRDWRRLWLKRRERTQIVGYEPIKMSLHTESYTPDL